MLYKTCVRCQFRTPQVKHLCQICGNTKFVETTAGESAAEQRSTSQFLDSSKQYFGKVWATAAAMAHRGTAH